MEIHANEFQLVDEILMSFVKIALKLNSDFAPYISLIQKAIRRNKVQDRCAQFDLAIKTITKNDPIETFQQNLELNEVGDLFADNNEHFDNQIQARERDLRTSQRMNTEELLREFDTSKNLIADDWTRWLIKTSYQLLKQNPSPVLFACSTLNWV